MAAETFPSKSIRIVVGNAVGGVDDIWARRYAQQMSERLQQTVVVDNRPGASGTLAAMEVLKAPKDGYTLLYGGMASLIQFPSAGGTVRYKPKEDFEPVAMATLGYPVLTAGSNSWAKSIQDLVQKAKAAPANADAYGCGTSGQAATSHFACMMVAKAVGRVQARALQGRLVGGHGRRVRACGFCGGLHGEISPLTLGKRLTPLVVFSPKRFPLYPDTPTVKEVGLEGWRWSASAPSLRPRDAGCGAAAQYDRDPVVPHAADGALVERCGGLLPGHVTGRAQGVLLQGNRSVETALGGARYPGGAVSARARLRSSGSASLWTCFMRQPLTRTLISHASALFRWVSA
jgi:tripartite-type tricarboxylate transporter receptor subunit TctC